MEQRVQVRVYYEDTDVGGVVYYANYLKFCERARSEIFFQNGLSPVFDGCHFVVKAIEANYIKSAKFGDVLDIKTTLIEKKSASIKLLQEVYKGDEKIFDMSVVLVFLKGEKITKIPKNILVLFK
jgi:acyl-CoA thioester hydrolase